MSYKVNILSSPALMVGDYSNKEGFRSSKADIGGLCVRFITNSETHMTMWRDNFHFMGDRIRSHCTILSIKDNTREIEVDYDPLSATAVLYNFDYYGWIKSIALAIATDILERSHGMFAVHGAALDIDGKGVAIIAPSKTGKTTQSWGLLRLNDSTLITDDWFFVKNSNSKPRIYGSEKNCYIDADIGDVWNEYKPLVSLTSFDGKGRGIGNIRWILGQDSVQSRTSLNVVILLKRNTSEPKGYVSLTTAQAIEYLVSIDFCNPHQMIRSEEKMKLRRQSYFTMLNACNVYMINTTGTPEETQSIIREVIFQKR